MRTIKMPHKIGKVTRQEARAAVLAAKNKKEDIVVRLRKGWIGGYVDSKAIYEEPTDEQLECAELIENLRVLLTIRDTEIRSLNWEIVSLQKKCLDGLNST